MSVGPNPALGLPRSTAPPHPSGNRPRRGRGDSHGRSDDRRRAFRSALTCASPHARTHNAVLLAVPPLPPRCASYRAVDVASVCLVSALAPRAAATLLVIAEATSRVRTSARKCGRPCCCCGCGLRRSPDSGISREVARGPRDARAAMSMRARLGAAPRAARNWGLVRPLLPAWPGAPAVVVLAFLTRPTGGTAGEWPSKSPNFHTSHHMTSPGTDARPRGLPQPPSRPKGASGRNFPNTAPFAHHRFRATLEHRPLAPPTRAVHSRCPFALPARVARSRRPLAPQPSLTGARPSWSVLTSQYRPICTHPRSCLQRALLRGRLGHARRASTSGAQGIVQVGATSHRHSVLLIQHRFGDAHDA